MNEIWYVSGTLASTITRRLATPVRALPRAWAGVRSPARVAPVWAAAGVLLLACASRGAGAGAAPVDVALVPGAGPSVATTSTVSPAGARCANAACACRQPGEDDAEKVPPAEGVKRFEIRMSADGGSVSLDASGLGTIAASGPVEVCSYVDVASGSTHDLVFAAKESVAGQGVSPILSIAEYGPKGPYWYDVIDVKCDGPRHRCDRKSADAWSAAMRERKRGRVDPCGSSVVSRLRWDTSGGQSERDGGLFRDMTVSMTMEIKKFPTQFAPGSTECVPK